MNILRHMPGQRDHFTVIQNTVLRDSRLSFRARGILCVLFSHRDGFYVTAQTLTDGSPSEGRDAIRTALTEIEDVGYLRRPRRQDPLTGHWHTIWMVFPEGDAATWDRVEEPPTTDDGFSGIGATRPDDAKAQVTPETGFQASVNQASKEGPEKKTKEEETDRGSGSRQAHVGGGLEMDGSGSNHLPVVEDDAPQLEPEQFPDLNTYLAQLERAWSMP